MFAAATALLARPTSLSAYTLHTTNPGPSPGSSSTNLPSLSSSSSTPGASSSRSPLASPSKPFNVGLWRVIGATHRTTNKDVSVWVFEKRILDGIKGDGSGRNAAQAREFVVEQLKKEATSLSRLRHPDILHMVEPLEETRSELTFVTEVITSSLSSILSSANASASSSSGRHRPPPAAESPELDLDEVEIQKGTLQIAKGLGFLHQQAKLVHLNLSPEAILVNAKGDWKLSGLGLTIAFEGSGPEGRGKYVYPEVDARLPPQVQWKLDYLAPEYALDSTLNPASDLYSLGCVLYAVHMGGKPPFQNRGSMQSLRDNAEGPLLRREFVGGSRWERCSSELKDLLPRLLTRHPSNRLSLASLPSHPFFSSLAISTLNFLDATTFASKPREEKATFLRGLVRVLPTFSEGLRRRKILPSLLEEMKDPYLLPFILPNVFEISKGLGREEFTTVLPKLQPLFALKDPPQNMLTLLEHLTLFEEKTTPAVFRENVMPLIYNSLECEHLPVQERVLKAVPHLCEILDYGTVQNVLLVKVAILFTRTRILGVKVQTLECFTAMVKTLDKATLTTKLVPLLAKIKTKEPAVMMATLHVHEAMGQKVDREAIATLVLPQLWAMSMGPLLNAEQFGKFMAVIKSLGSRVEAEHTAHLRDVRRLEAQTASYASQFANGADGQQNGGIHSHTGEVDFEALVKGSTTPIPGAFDAGGGSSFASNPVVVTDPWGDDGWADGPSNDNGLANAFPGLGITAASTGGSASASPFFPTATPASTSPAPPTPSTFPSLPAPAPKLKARPIPSSSFNSSAFTSPSPPTTLSPSILSPAPMQPLQPQTFAPLQPTTTTTRPAPQAQRNTSQPGGVPNYNLSLSPQPPAASPSYASPIQQPQQQPFSFPLAPTIASPAPPASATPSQQPAVRPPPGWSSGLMQPTKAAPPAWGGGLAKGGNMGWDDLDPLK